MDILDIIKTIITIASLGFGVYQYIKKNQLQKYVTAESVGYYRDSALLLGSVKRCLDNIKNSNTVEARDEAGISVGLIEALYNASVRNVYHQTHYDESVLTDWIKVGKIDEHHKPDFMRYV